VHVIMIEMVVDDLDTEGGDMAFRCEKIRQILKRQGFVFLSLVSNLGETRDATPFEEGHDVNEVWVNQDNRCT